MATLVRGVGHRPLWGVATHYELLGVAPGASQDEIQKAYRQLARDHHPDTGAAASEIMAELNAAWTVLGDPARRRAYDDILASVTRPRAAPGAPPDLDADDEDEDEDIGTWWDEPDGPEAPASLGELVVLLPVGLFALSIAAFAFSVMSQSGTVMAMSLILLPLAIVTFMLTPLVVMMRRARARGR